MFIHGNKSLFATQSFSLRKRLIQEGLDSMDPSKNADTIEGKTVEDWLEQGIKFLNLSQLNEALQAFNMALQS